MSKGIKIANVDKIADRLIYKFEPNCWRVAVAGSIRRGEALVRDIEIVAQPKQQIDGLFSGQKRSLLDPVLDNMKLFGHLDTLKDGPKYKQFKLISTRVPINLDLFIANEENWGLILAIRTGPAAFSKRMVTPRRRGGLLHNDYRVHGGYVWREVCSEADLACDIPMYGDNMMELDGDAYVKVPMQQEADFFELLLTGWVNPTERR